MFESIYDEFMSRFIKKAKSLKLGIDNGCDLGPVINKKQYKNIIAALEKAKAEGGKILTGGQCGDESLRGGYYIEPSVITNLDNDNFLNNTEIFGPVTTVQSVKDMKEALEKANNSEYGLTAAIHTNNINRALWYAKNIKTGLVNVNIGTFGRNPICHLVGMDFQVMVLESLELRL